MSSGGSLVTRPDCKPAFPSLNLAISPAYSRLPVLGWAAIWDGNFTVGCPLRGSRGEKKEKGFWSTKKKKIREIVLTSGIFLKSHLRVQYIFDLLQVNVVIEVWERDCDECRMGLVKNQSFSSNS
jgi:hypothetical protein